MAFAPGSNSGPTYSSALLSAFANKFPEAAKLLQSYNTVLALLDETATQANRTGAGISINFGGYSDERKPPTSGPATDPFLNKATIWLPRSYFTNKDNTRAITHFMFELQNALRANKFVLLDNDVCSNAVNAQDYAFKAVKLEIEGAVKIGEMWAKILTEKGLSEKTLVPNATYYYFDIYKPYNSGIKTMDGLTRDALNYTYSNIAGPQLSGKTREWYYMNIRYLDVKAKKCAAIPDISPIG